MALILPHLDQLYSAAFEPFDLPVIEAYVLRALYEQDGQRPSDLARVVGRAPTSFTPILDKLARKGFIERRPDIHDRRAINVHLTQRAKSLQQSILTAFDQVEASLLDCLAADLQAKLQDQLLVLQQITLSTQTSHTH